MEITLEGYIKNPSGTRAHMVGERDAAAAIYQQRFNNIMLKCAGNIKYYMFKEQDESRYVLFIKMPSESIDGLTYDVVLDFYTKDDPKKKSTKLDEYCVRFFANDPNFTYTYAYTFKKNKLIVPELTAKLDPRSLKEKPKVTNPHTTVGYCKSIYSAYLFYSLRGLSQKVAWTGSPSFKHGASVDHLIMSTQNKLIQTERLRKIQAATKKGSMHIGDVEDLDNLETKTRQVDNIKTVNKAYDKVYKGNVKRAATAKKTARVKYIR